MRGVKSKDILLSVNMGTESHPNWLLIGCSTSDGLLVHQEIQLPLVQNVLVTL